MPIFSLRGVIASLGGFCILVQLCPVKVLDAPPCGRGNSLRIILQVDILKLGEIVGKKNSYYPDKNEGITL